MCDHFYGLNQEEFNELRTCDVLEFKKRYGDDLEPTRETLLPIINERKLTNLIKS